jgi:PTH1 family peptidyl-tRNA hydrolase
VGLLRRAGGTLDALVVGLGNPGSRYANTRHNVGFVVVDELARRTGAGFRSKYGGRFGEATHGEARIALLEPETFMNNSGASVGAAARFYKLDAADVVVVHDDIGVDYGRVRAKAGGGLQGHNGLRSIAEALGTREFVRVRLGLGRPGRGDRREIADWVLAPFDDDEDPAAMITAAADCVELILVDGIEAATAAYP